MEISVGNAVSQRLTRHKDLAVRELFKAAMEKHHGGNFLAANEMYQQVLKMDASNVGAIHMLGLLASQVGQIDCALVFYNEALKIEKKQADIYADRGGAYLALGKPNEAAMDFESAIDLDKSNGDHFYNLALALQGLGRVEAAQLSYLKTIALSPNHALALNNLGGIYHAQNKLQKAVDSYTLAIESDALYPAPLNNRGVAKHKLEKFQSAISDFRSSIILNPRYCEAYNNLGVSLQRIGQLEEALSAYTKSLEICPEYYEALNNRGTVLKELHQFEGALIDFDKAIETNTNYAPDAILNKSLLLLLLGNLKPGWKLYESRWDTVTHSKFKRNFSQPLWLGIESLNQKTILLHSEQGLGDTIQFCRFAPIISELGANVVLEVQPELTELLKSLPGKVKVLEKGAALPHFDYHCPLMSLPFALSTDINSIPRNVPYLKPSDKAIKKWRSKLGISKRPLVGLVWRGGKQNSNDHNRSMELLEIVTSVPPKYDLVSLQKDIFSEDKRSLSSLANIQQFGDELVNFLDTAALIQQLEVIITVDTSVAHLAGAMGKPTCLLVPYLPDFRWLLGRKDSPWYPNVKIFRQTNTRSWDAPLSKIREYLNER